MDSLTQYWAFGFGGWIGTLRAVYFFVSNPDDHSIVEVFVSPFVGGIALYLFMYAIFAWMNISEQIAHSMFRRDILMSVLTSMVGVFSIAIMYQVIEMSRNRRTLAENAAQETLVENNEESDIDEENGEGEGEENEEDDNDGEDEDDGEGEDEENEEDDNDGEEGENGDNEEDSEDEGDDEEGEDETGEDETGEDSGEEAGDEQSSGELNNAQVDESSFENIKTPQIGAIVSTSPVPEIPDI